MGLLDFLTNTNVSDWLGGGSAPTPPASIAQAPAPPPQAQQYPMVPPDMSDQNGVFSAANTQRLAERYPMLTDRQNVPMNPPVPPPSVTGDGGNSAPGGQPPPAMPPPGMPQGRFEELNQPTPLPPQAGPQGMQPPLPPGATQIMRPPQPQRPSDNPLVQSLFSQSNMAGLGKGLSAVAQNWNKPAGAAFAAGMGGALEGQSAENQQEQKMTLEKKKQAFDQLSTSFNDYLKGEQEKNNKTRLEAMAKYMSARADAIAAGGSATGSNAWQTTPFGKMLNVDRMVDARKDREMKVLQQQFKDEGTSTADRKTALDALEQKYDQVRKNAYTQYGIDPNVAQQMKMMGTQAPKKDANGQWVFPPNAPPFDSRTMTEDQFNSHVPKGAYYLDNTGTPRIRTTAPGEDKKSEAAPNYDDMAAMS